MTDETSYPAVRFMLRFGNIVAVLMGLAVAVAGLWAAMAGMGWPWGAAGLVGGLLAFFFLRIFSELIQIIADTLLPQ